MTVFDLSVLLFCEERGSESADNGFGVAILNCKICHLHCVIILFITIWKYQNDRNATYCFGKMIILYFLGELSRFGLILIYTIMYLELRKKPCFDFRNLWWALSIAGSEQPLFRFMQSRIRSLPCLWNTLLVKLTPCRIVYANCFLS